MAEAARSAVKTDEVEWQLTLNDVRFAHDAFWQMKSGLRRVKSFYKKVKSAARVKSAKPVAVEIPAEFLNDLIFYNRKSSVSKSLLLRREGG